MTIGDVGRPPVAETFQAVVRRLRFFAVMGEAPANRELEGSWSGYGHDVVPERASGGFGTPAAAAAAVHEVTKSTANAVTTTAAPRACRSICRSDYGNAPE